MLKSVKGVRECNLLWEMRLVKCMTLKELFDEALSVLLLHQHNLFMFGIPQVSVLKGFFTVFFTLACFNAFTNLSE